MRTRVLAMAATGMATAVLAFGATSASAATGVDGFTIIHASQGTQVHHCEKVGADSQGNQAIICVDINTNTWHNADSEEYWGEAQSQTEAYCQKNGVIEACKALVVEGEYATPLESQTYNSACGTDVGLDACGSGRLYGYSKWYLTSPASNYNCGSAPQSDSDVWSLAVKGIRWDLPSGTRVNLGSNYSSGHYYVCY